MRKLRAGASASGPGHGAFAKARAQAELDAMRLRDRAVRTVADQAVDAEDLRSLLAMLGLDGTDGPAALQGGLAGYVLAVAAAVRVPAEATEFEISDTATAYLALTEHWVLRPSRDLMLVWTERHGWSVAVETAPAEHPIVVGYLGGDDLVPGPHTVARFVASVVTGHRPPVPCPTFPIHDNRDDITQRLHRYAIQPGRDIR